MAPLVLAQFHGALFEFAFGQPAGGDIAMADDDSLGSALSRGDVNFEPAL